MITNKWVNMVLTLSGVVGFGIGLAALFWPDTFFGSTGIDLGADVNLLSEVRAPGMALVTFGLFLLLAVIRPGLRKVALWAGAMLYLSYGGGRIIGIVLDGIPHFNLQAALGLELVIGLLCIYVLWRQRNAATYA